MKNKYFSFNVGLLSGIAICVAFIIIAISFFEISWLPTWEDIFSTGYTTDDTELDCITFLDVGQGDCALIQSNGRFMFIDCGNEKNSLHSVVKGLKRGIADSIDCLCISHYHDDHCLGVSEIAKYFNIRTAVLPKSDTNNTFYNSINAYLSKQTDITPEIFTAKPGMVINIGDFEITVLAANSDFDNENDCSTVLMAKCRDMKFLFTGDIELAGERQLISDKIDFDCDVLKVAHHGSKSSSSAEFLSVATPEYAVISCGKNNQFNHPDTLTLERLDDVNAKVYRTDVYGDIKFTVNENDLTVTVG